MNSEHKINYIAKEILAKLIAQENLIIEHRNVSTAGFDTKNRILVLPTYKDITEDIYDLFIGHECSHALNTPASGWEKITEKIKEYPRYDVICNIIEDARIEKLIKRKLPGLSKSFFYAYKQLHEKNFFGVKDKDPKKLHFMDRLNLYFKVGISGNMQIPFTDEEKSIVRDIEKVETFDQVLAIADKLAEKIKQEEKNQKQQEKKQGKGKGKGQSGKSSKSKKQSKNSEDLENQQSSSDENESDDSGDDEDFSSCQDDGESCDQDQDQDQDQEQGQKQDQDVNEENSSEEEQEQKASSCEKSDSLEEMGITYSNEKKNYKKYIDEENWTPKNTYVNIPDVNSFDLKNFIVDYKDVHSRILSYYNTCSTGPEQISLAISKFQEFRVRNNPVVSYLAKEFEMKKSADEFSRTLTAKTGLLDTNKIHSYKYSDDIFLKREVIQDGKNHGLVMFIDCSDSMNSCIADTFEQLINLVMFCRRANIPFEVYGFMDANCGYYWSSDRKPSKYIIKQEGDFCIEDFILKNYFSSRMSTPEFNAACINIQAMINGYRRVKHISGYSCDIPDSEKLTSTPLNSTIICATKIITDFRKKYGLQKVHAVFLTDGESNSSSYWEKNTYGELKSSRVDSGYRTAIIFRNKKSKKEYKVDNCSRRWNETECLYNCLRDTTGARVLGFYLEHNTSNIKNLICIQTNQGYRSKKVKEEIKKVTKDGSYAMKKFFGYDELYVILTKEMKIDDQEVKIDRSKVSSKAVAKAFTSALKGRIQNRVLLSKFIEQIA